MERFTKEMVDRLAEFALDFRATIEATAITWKDNNVPIVILGAMRHSLAATMLGMQENPSLVVKVRASGDERLLITEYGDTNAEAARSAYNMGAVLRKLHEKLGDIEFLGLYKTSRIDGALADDDGSPGGIGFLRYDTEASAHDIESAIHMFTGISVVDYQANKFYYAVAGFKEEEDCPWLAPVSIGDEIFEEEAEPFDKTLLDIFTEAVAHGEIPDGFLTERITEMLSRPIPNYGGELTGEAFMDFANDAPYALDGDVETHRKMVQ